MADQPAQTTEKEAKKKCAQTGVNLKRVKRYYRDGSYFINKNAFKAWNQKKLEDKKAAQETAKAEAAKAEPPAEEGKQESPAA